MNDKLVGILGSRGKDNPLEKTLQSDGSYDCDDILFCQERETKKQPQQIMRPDNKNLTKKRNKENSNSEHEEKCIQFYEVILQNGLDPYDISSFIPQKKEFIKKIFGYKLLNSNGKNFDYVGECDSLKIGIITRGKYDIGKSLSKKLSK